MNGLPCLLHTHLEKTQKPAREFLVLLKQTWRSGQQRQVRNRCPTALAEPVDGQLRPPRLTDVRPSSHSNGVCDRHTGLTCSTWAAPTLSGTQQPLLKRVSPVLQELRPQRAVVSRELERAGERPGMEPQEQVSWPRAVLCLALETKAEPRPCRLQVPPACPRLGPDLDADSGSEQRWSNKLLRNQPQGTVTSAQLLGVLLESAATLCWCPVTSRGVAQAWEGASPWAQGATGLSEPLDSAHHVHKPPGGFQIQSNRGVFI